LASWLRFRSAELRVSLRLRCSMKKSHGTMKKDLNKYFASVKFLIWKPWAPFSLG
jgi:hypothetical protein